MRVSADRRRHRVAHRAALAGALVVLMAGCGGSSGDASETTTAVPDQETNQELHDRLPADIRESGKVKVGTEALYPPFESFADDDETIVGLDPDLAEALGQILGVEVVMSHTAFDGLLTALDGGRFDLVMAAITDTKDRQEKYDFVDYFMTGQAIVVKKGNPEGIEGVEDLCGKNVSVLTSSTQQKLLDEFNTDECAQDLIEVTALPSDKDALLQVQTGRADATFTQDATGAYNASTIGGGNQFEIANSEPLLPVPVGMVFDKGETDLRDAFKAALEELIASGDYDEILEKHGLSTGAYKDATINGGTA